jgi:hypothetical protein
MESYYEGMHLVFMLTYRNNYQYLFIRINNRTGERYWLLYNQRAGSNTPGDTADNFSFRGMMHGSELFLENSRVYGSLTIRTLNTTELKKGESGAFALPSGIIFTAIYQGFGQFTNNGKDFKLDP